MTNIFSSGQSIYAYGEWIWDNQKNTSVFNLWFFTRTAFAVPLVIKYIKNGTYWGYYYSDGWGFYGDTTKTDNDYGITLSINGNRSQATLTVTNLQMANDASNPYQLYPAPVLNFTKTFNIFGDIKGNAAFCGPVWNANDYSGLYSYQVVLEGGFGAGLPADTASRC